MIELSTGVVFLMSSLYGSGQSDNHIQMIKADTEGEKATITQTIDSGSFSTIAMEMYLRMEYANTPILVEIARCESEFRQFDKNGKLIHGRANPADVGVMQINEFYHGDTARNMGIDVRTVEGNVAFAKYLYSKYGSKPWSASKPCWSKARIIEIAKK